MINKNHKNINFYLVPYKDPALTKKLLNNKEIRNHNDAMIAVIDKIKVTNSYYELTPSQSVALNKQGIDSKVLDYIYTSREQMLRNNVADEINKREKIKRAELDKLRNQQLQQQQLYDPFCRYGPYGYGGFGSRYGSRFGVGAGFGRPFGCW